MAPPAPVRRGERLRPRPAGGRPPDDRAAVHAVHHRPRAADRGADAGGAHRPAESRRRDVPRRDHRLEPVQHVQGLPAAAAQRAAGAVAPALAVRAHAPPAAAQALGLQDGRHPVAPLRRRRDDHRPVPDGDRLAGGVGHSPRDRRRGVDVAQLAARAHRAGDHPRRDVDELHAVAPRAADLPQHAEGRRDHRRARRRDVLGHPRRARLSRRGARDARVHARPPHAPAKGDVRAPPRAHSVDVVGAAVERRERRDRVVRRRAQHQGRRVDRRHHGLPVVHVPDPESGLEHRELVLRAAAVPGGDGARVRSARDGRTTSRTAPTRATRRPS